MAGLAEIPENPSKRLAEIGVAALDFLQQSWRLCVLAPQAENRGARDVGVVNVSRQEAAKISGVFSRSTAALLVRQELDAVDIPKDFRLAWRPNVGELKILDFFGLAFPIESNQFRDVAPVNLGQGESQFFLERLLQNGKIPVLAEDQRDYQPVISRAHLPIVPVIAQKRSLAPRGNIGRRPTKRFGAGMKIGGSVPYVASRKQVTPADRLRSGSDQAAIHDDLVARSQIARHKFLLRRNVGQQDVRVAGKLDLLPLG